MSFFRVSTSVIGVRNAHPFVVKRLLNATFLTTDTTVLTTVESYHFREYCICVDDVPPPVPFEANQDQSSKKDDIQTHNTNAGTHTYNTHT